MRKPLIIIIAITLTFACKAQEPDIECYSEDTVIVRENRLTQKHELKIDSIINSMYSQEYVDNKDLKIDSLNTQVSNLQSILARKGYGHIADTFKFTLEGINDSTLTIVNKTDENISTSIKNGNKRITSMFNEEGRKVFLMNDTVHSADSISSDTVGSFQLFEDGEVLIYYDPKKKIE